MNTEAHSPPAQQARAEPTVKVLVAEDDPVQRNSLVDLLASLRPDWGVVACVGSVDEVQSAVDSLIPDLCLIDIHLQGSDDPNWIKNLGSDLAIIYVTGDPEFAVHAFDSDAIDYVLKPITARRLKTALDRASRDPRLSGSRSTGGEGGPGRTYLTRVTISRGAETIVAMPEDIAYLEADMKYTRVVTTRGAGLVRMGINELSARLPEEQFLRIHRGYVVNLKFVSSVKRNELGYLEVHLNGRQEVLRVSKSYQHVFRPD
ncbi:MULTISPECIES: LytR/AlgR family response regulator transcription factor [Roseateles]|uniref:LytTR family DNA-binding domain-containing protein n=1 Tax=Pelomonas caseinilytica TaxID=2906763 RepID=A0ABS8XKV8_9BURK|nr:MULTISPECIES: LytTR family DNA-binding domain-containing protein [unclassified Roseateles]MCE4540398.1 LytTR family DNA-binding domain-containing protein [Pelomonas sp. P7]HEV6965545.1 LytTR family DNA-binding domain-containing protein [Roseateles sp.]